MDCNGDQYLTKAIRERPGALPGFCVLQLSVCLMSHSSAVTMSQEHSLIKYGYLDP